MEQLVWSHGSIPARVRDARLMTGGQCVHCGVTAARTRHCAVCGEVVCTNCFPQRRCRVAVWRHHWGTHAAMERLKAERDGQRGVAPETCGGGA